MVVSRLQADGRGWRDGNYEYWTCWRLCYGAAAAANWPARQPDGRQRAPTYGRRAVDTFRIKKDEERYQLSSRHFPYYQRQRAVGSVLAFKHSRHSWPLAVLLSLLIVYIVRLATASRMSFSPRLIWPLPNGSAELFCQPLLNARTQQWLGAGDPVTLDNPRRG